MDIYTFTVQVYIYNKLLAKVKWSICIKIIQLEVWVISEKTEATKFICLRQNYKCVLKLKGMECPSKVLI